MSSPNPYNSPISQSSTAPVEVMTGNYEVKQIDLLSAGIISAVLNGAVGLLGGAVLSLMTMVGIAGAPNGGGATILLFGGLAAFILIPVGNAIAGFLGGIIGALIYNLCANLVGGIKLTLK